MTDSFEKDENKQMIFLEAKEMSYLLNFHRDEV